MKLGVRIMPKSEVLDSQGRALEKTLQHHGKKISACRVGKYIVLELPTESFEHAKQQAEEMIEFVLYNPLIETYAIERLPS